MKLWLIRHPQPRVEAGVCYGASDLVPDASAVEDLARRLADALPQGIALACSPLRRCTTAAGALQRLRPDVQVHVDPRLRELDFGTWEGRPWDTIARQELDAWTADFANYRPGGGESAQALLLRVGAMLEAAPGKSAWLTHAGVIRAATLWRSGVRKLTEAAQWPKDGPGFGEWVTLDLAAMEDEDPGRPGFRPSPE